MYALIFCHAFKVKFIWHKTSQWEEQKVCHRKVTKKVAVKMKTKILLKFRWMGIHWGESIVSLIKMKWKQCCVPIHRKSPTHSTLDILKTIFWSQKVYFETSIAETQRKEEMSPNCILWCVWVCWDVWFFKNKHEIVGIFF